MQHAPIDRLVCLGLGYTALRLAGRLEARNVALVGTVRTSARAGQLSARPISVHVWDGHTPAPDLALTPTTAVLVSVPPDADGCPAARAYGRAAAAVPVIYLSTTGVYGDRAGAWVDEASEPAPSSPRGERRLVAERRWQRAAGRTALVRLPGIYGPGRSPIDRVRDGSARRIVKPGQVFSRIHVDDLAAGLEALIDAGVPAGVYHFADDEPAPPEAPIAYAADLLDLPAPPIEDFDAAELSPMARSFYAECKRVASTHTRTALGWTPRYPSYREGLAAILESAHR